ncbi:MAG TPA: DinB family protein [Beutenbergiaceae bacterium]|nr:DinB family protein [Beutenbergiaceae bacterium]
MNTAPMTPAAALLTDGFGRVRESVHAVVSQLTPAELDEHLEPGTNTVAWLIWHLTRVQDDHLAEFTGQGQRWQAEGWHRTFDLPLDAADTGFGHSPEQAAQVGNIAAEHLSAYHDAVHQATTTFLGGLSDDDLDQVVDSSWDPPVTLGVRLVSVLDDDTQHVGQAAFVAGVLARRRSG